MRDLSLVFVREFLFYLHSLSEYLKKPTHGCTFNLKFGALEIASRQIFKLTLEKNIFKQISFTQNSFVYKLVKNKTIDWDLVLCCIGLVLFRERSHTLMCKRGSLFTLLISFPLSSSFEFGFGPRGLQGHASLNRGTLLSVCACLSKEKMHPSAFEQICFFRIFIQHVLTKEIFPFAQKYFWINLF